MTGSNLPKPDFSPSPPSLSIPSLIIRLIGLIIFLALALFGLAARLDWLFILAFSGFLAYYGAWALRNDPAQLQERSRAGQNTKAWDKVILTIYTFLLILMLAIAALDAGRFRWAPAPLLVQVVGWLGLILAGRWILWTTSVNTFLSRTVRIQEERGQQVIDQGPYHWVRHPMYSGILVLMVCVPLILGSLWALAPGVLIDVLFVIRTMLEDRTLQAELPGYADYAERVRYRLVPGVW